MIINQDQEQHQEDLKTHHKNRKKADVADILILKKKKYKEEIYKIILNIWDSKKHSLDKVKEKIYYLMMMHSTILPSPCLVYS